jgi:hypothetical protein
MHPEIVQHIVPEGGTWKRVVDRLNMERRYRPGTAATVYNKAKQGRDIINEIANYRPGDFASQSRLSAFIGAVDSFITTQSILQRGTRTDSHKESTDVEDIRDEPRPALTARRDSQAREPEKATAGGDEWDF